MIQNTVLFGLATAISVRGPVPVSAAVRLAKERRAVYARIETEIAEAKLSYSINV